MAARKKSWDNYHLGLMVRKDWHFQIVRLWEKHSRYEDWFGGGSHAPQVHVSWIVVFFVIVFGQWEGNSGDNLGPKMW